MHHLTKVEFCFNLLMTDNLIIPESYSRFHRLDFSSYFTECEMCVCAILGRNFICDNVDDVLL